MLDPDVDFTVQYRPGRELTGTEAELVPPDSEPYALASVRLGNTGLECIFDPRAYPEKEEEVLALINFISRAANAHDRLTEAVTALVRAVRLNTTDDNDKANVAIQKGEGALRLAKQG